MRVEHTAVGVDGVSTLEGLGAGQQGIHQRIHGVVIGIVGVDIGPQHRHIGKHRGLVDRDTHNRQLVDIPGDLTAALAQTEAGMTVHNIQQGNDHIVFCELGIAFSSKQINGAQKINALRFYDREVLKNKRKRLQFAAAAGAELIKETTNVLAKAKAVHDELESHYIAAMDFDALGEYADSLVEEIKKRK